MAFRPLDSIVLAARHIHGDRFGEIDVFAGRHGRGRLLRMEVGRRYDRYGVERLLQQPAISRQAGETLLRFHAQRIAQGVDAVGKIVGRSHDVIAAMLLEQLGDPGAPATAADDAQIDLGIGGGAESETRIDQRDRSRRRSAPAMKRRLERLAAALVGAEVRCSCDMGRIP